MKRALLLGFAATALLFSGAARAEGVEVTVAVATYRCKSDGHPVATLPEKKECIASAEFPARVDVPFESRKIEGESTITAKGMVSADNRNPHRVNLKLEYAAKAKGSEYSLSSRLVMTLDAPKVLGGTDSAAAGNDRLVTVVTVKSVTP